MKDVGQQDNQHQNELWKLYFDGSRSKNGVGRGCMLISPIHYKYYGTLGFLLAAPIIQLSMRP